MLGKLIKTYGALGAAVALVASVIDYWRNPAQRNDYPGLALGYLIEAVLWPITLISLAQDMISLVRRLAPSR